ncbi:Galactose mutarotase-like domain-containing protein [Cynara cardunculus var. scolymus]|uniref:alpha-mannosidase n=1 Tax=Cynara cardunculus var. scolymus TaxID=59895 RepID=A0A103Y5I0_CYNCS|nr:Galactose mutarotase-like domain-containing protein [Cynara cardunculus var. scolymus]
MMSVLLKFPKFSWVFVVCVAVSCGLICGYETGVGIVEGKLNVHLVPHSHDDVGWLKTVDQYFVGSNNSIQGACVENVLDSVVMSLLRDPNRKNGGWCMHDEAATHYVDMIDQTTLGHDLIKSNFNITPSAGWQIDPFGHSAVQAYLLGAELGFDSLHFARIDYQDRAKRKGDKSLEVVWRGSKTFGSSSQIFTNVFPRHYSAPDGFNFEVRGDFEPVQDDPLLFDMNVKKRVNDFIDAALTQANVTRTNHIMWTMGDDFQYQYAESFLKLSQLPLKLLPFVKMLFFLCVDMQTMEMLTGQAARQLEYLAGRRTRGPNTFSLGDALGIAQHHDAVTGTAKQHTTRDYEKRLAIGAVECPLLNISFCPPTENIPSGKSLVKLPVVVAYNPLGWSRTDVVRIPVKDANLVVQDDKGNTIKAQFIEFDNITSNLRSFYAEAYLGISPTEVPKYWLLFQASVPPLGFISVVDTPQNDSIEIGPGSLKMSFSLQSGQLKRIINSRTGIDLPIQQSYLWYGSGSGNQPSGAYIFHPDGSAPVIVSRSVPIKVIRGPLVDEVTRLYKDKEHAEFEFIIGPIPTDDGVGKEVITRITADMATNKVLYTDSNGRDFLKRLNLGMFTTDNKTELSVLVDRATGGASINDGQMEIMFHRRMLFDDGRGVGEALDETVCTKTTCQGLAVRGTYYMSANHVGSGSRWRRTTGQEIYSSLLLAFTHEKQDNWKASHSMRSTTMDPNYTLPPNIALITLQELEGGSALLRLAHLYEAGEDADFSTLVQVELKKMFGAKTIKTITETSLSANQDKSVIKRMPWKVEGGSGSESAPIRGGRLDPSALVVELGPMEIRTFILQI